MLAAAAGFQNFLAGLSTLAKFKRGVASFVVNASGDLEHAETVATVKMLEGENLDAFYQRLKAEHGLQPGDRVEILDNDGKLDTARLFLKPRNN